MAYGQCTECGRNLPTDELIDCGFDDDGVGGVIVDYICPDCDYSIQVEDYYQEQIDLETQNES